jgi:hypothetical protein
MRVRTRYADYKTEVRERVRGCYPEQPDEQREQWAWLRRRLTPPARTDHAPAAVLIQAYEAATGTLVGCD